ncbi:neutral zinc metallopeptidase [Nonomuraea sp. NBC_01738]|uniref:neutral zinc metallopeptidase n=1 Tax=Nonomuraea sp. NBC_01738 TaxID=2976003 RepID=UPI002E0EE0E3|nr:neutral zinc metallopeptidase [Nonomuraea sp. NBC_01738]
MKLPLVASATAVLAGLVLTGMAGAASAAVYPIKSAQLTKNRLYLTGALAPTTCREKPVRPRHVPLAKAYVRAITACLNAAWGAHLATAGMSFVAPRVSFVTRKGTRFCGARWDEQAGTYCVASKKFAIGLDKTMLADPSDLFLMDTVAHEYGHHLQNLAGIHHAFLYEPYRNKKEELEQLRRFELQAECLSGVFIGSVWAGLDRTGDDWRFLLDVVRGSGDENTKVKDHGKGRNQRYWLNKGFTAAAPSACNTWAAPAWRVS